MLAVMTQGPLHANAHRALLQHHADIEEIFNSSPFRGARMMMPPTAYCARGPHLEAKDGAYVVRIETP
eukprot:473929-Rhodomonas_salina.1